MYMCVQAFSEGSVYVHVCVCTCVCRPAPEAAPQPARVCAVGAALPAALGRQARGDGCAAASPARPGVHITRRARCAHPIH